MRGRIVWLIAAMQLVPSCAAVRGPKYIERITIENPYEYAFTVAVGDGRSGWLNLGEVVRGSERATEEVIDIGQRWVFRFRYSEGDEAHVSFTRAELVAARWRVAVPEELATRLRAKNEPPSDRG